MDKVDRIDTIRFWCNKVLPLAYDDSLSYMELLNKVVFKVNEVIVVTNEIQNTIETTIEETLEEWYENGKLADIIGDAIDEINARIDEIDSEISGEGGLDSRLDAAEDDIDALETSVGNLDTAINGEGGLDDRLDTAEGDIDSLEDALEDAVSDLNDRIDAINFRDLSSKKMLLLGDSYNGGTGGVWGKGWGYYVQQYTGATCDIIHQNYGGFTCGGNSGASYPDLTYEQVIGQLSNDAGYDIIVVQCGPNDANPNRNPDGASAIATAEASFIVTTKLKYPNAELIILPCYTDLYPMANKQVRFLTMCRTAVANNVRTCFDSYLWMQNSGYLSQDGGHLTDSGYQLLGHYITAFLMGWDGSIIFQKNIHDEITILTPEGITPSDWFHVWVDKTNCYVNGAVVLTDTVNSWTNILTGLPAAKDSEYTTCCGWGATPTRNMRAGIKWGTAGEFAVQYGEAGTYQVIMSYPINLQTD